MALPALFRKKYTAKKLESKILRRVYIPSDKEWLRSRFSQAGDGLYTLDGGGLSKEDQKRLAGLAKSIKKNSGIVSKPKLLAVAVIFALVAGGYYYLRNVLIEKALVAGLEAVFQARAAVSGLDFDVFDAKLEWTRLEVANRDRPMKNLFETGHCEANFSMWDLLKARFVVENLEASDIRWNTDRASSGALPQAAKQETTENSGGLGEFAKEVSGSLMEALASFDVKALLESEFDKLATPKAALRIKDELETRTGQWKEKIGAVREQVKGLEVQARDIRAIDPRAIKKPEEVISLIAKVNAAAESVRKAGDTAKTLESDFNETSQAALQAKSELQKAVQADYDYAASLVSLSGGTAMSLATGLFTDFAREQLGDWYVYGMRALEIARKLPKDTDGGKKETEKKEDTSGLRYGRIVSFPNRDNLPKLWLKRIAVNTAGNKDQTFDGEITNITGAPDLINKPAAFDFAVAVDGKRFGLGGNIDMRRNAVASAEFRLSAEGLPLHIKFPKPFLTIRSLKGPLTTRASMRFLAAGGMDGTLSGDISPPTLEREGKSNAISDMAYSVLSSVKNFDVEAVYAIGGDRKLTLDLSSSVDQALKDGFFRYLKEQESVYKARIREELKTRLDAFIAENETLQKGIAELQKLVGDNITDVNAYKKLLDEKKKSLEEQAENLKKQAAGTLIKEVEKKLPELPKPPSLPQGFPKIR